jgi:hypothetical protein
MVGPFLSPSTALPMQPNNPRYSSTDEPYCFWQTYIADNSPTLNWFSCVVSKTADATFYAATITGNLTYPTTPFTAPTGTTSSSSTSASAPVLSNGAIIGISVGGGVVLIGCVAGIIWCCIVLRKRRSSNTTAPSRARAQLGRVSPVELPPNAAPVFYHGTPPNPSTAYSPTQSSTRFSPSQYQATLVSGEEIEYRRRMTPGSGNLGTDAAAELPTKRASTREREERDRGSYAEGDDWDHMTAR